MDTYQSPSQEIIRSLQNIANKLRILSIKATNAAKSGHPTSCTSIAELISVLFFHTMRYKVSNPRDASSDRFVLSKGHAAPILYAAWCEAGLFSQDHLMTLRKIDSELEGHPVPRQVFTDVGTGSLGQGLSCACGMAYMGKHIDKASYRVFCLLGDGESAEGAVWEAMSFASFYKLDNLVAIFDVNRLGQSQPTALQHKMDVYRQRAEAFGWNAIVIDGHDVEAVCRAFHEAEITTGRPTCLLAKTFKGRGIIGVEDNDGFHGKALGDKAEPAIAHLEKLIKGPVYYHNPRPVIEDAPLLKQTEVKLSEPPNYTLGQKLPIRNAYGTALAKLGTSCDRVVALDGDMKNSTFSITFMNAHPDRFIECFIAEQNMVGVAVGCATRGRAIPFVSTFAAFLCRASDQIRMAAVSQSSVNFVGSHVGCSIGEDGASQMALEDMAMFRALPGSVVFYPSDAVACERAVELAANYPGITFTRATRPDSAVIYANDEPFAIGKAKVVRQSEDDHVLVIAAGVTLDEAMKAANHLELEGIHVRILDPFTVKPIDKAGIVANAKATNGKVVVVEDHYHEGGLGEAVFSAIVECGFRVRHLAVPRVPQSGPCAALLEMFGISAGCIIKTVKELVGQ
ncbi:transketolase [Nematostella vectensis]|uniref:transketolase n=1 Tax=Nematostella vectensis TaxID=45351 RepID=UPI002076FFFF|nr:transketolase [Nematostella vectensis]